MKNNKNELFFLETLQSTLQIAYQNISNIHWHISGLHFFTIHKQTDKLRADILEFIDMTAEKLVMLHHNAIVDSKKIEQLSRIKEDTSLSFKEDSTQLVVNYLEEILKLITSVTFSFSATVQPMIDEIILSLDKWRWQFEKNY
ncbi:ferritin-like domain-containing protein [Mesomycoplasma neurolyticum]|uniref:DNA protection during starvation protein n=1 Tax=Mesomycoplasma neurolyticum TaxID=2120 RepID=A0A449A5B3_9BACT|nr:ferritin-like domain-containing protein [Mesomycoplasma neurolyticum]VEU59426.1 DNA protection during starvation protein [Mesomycoplasma neurolyticum]